MTFVGGYYSIIQIQVGGEGSGPISSNLSQFFCVKNGRADISISLWEYKTNTNRKWLTKMVVGSIKSATFSFKKMTKPRRGLKTTKKKRDQPKNVRKTSGKKVFPEDVKQLSLTLSDIRKASDVSESRFEVFMMIRRASAQRRYQFVKSAVEAQAYSYHQLSKVHFR